MVGRGFALDMREADEDELLDAGFECRVDEVLDVESICCRKKFIRARREQDTGEVDDAVSVPAGFFECRGIGEVGAVDSDVGG